MPKIALLCVLAGLGLISACPAPPGCRDNDVSAAIGTWFFAGVPSRGPATASEVQRPAKIELRADRTFSVTYDEPLPSGVSAATMSGTWNGGRRCMATLYGSGTSVATDPRIPSSSSIHIEDDQLTLHGAAQGMFDAQYTRTDPAVVTGSPTATPPATDTPSTPPPTNTPAPPTPNPWRGRH